MKSVKIEILPDFKTGELLEYEDSFCNYVVLVGETKTPTEEYFTGTVVFSYKSVFYVGYVSNSFRKDCFSRFTGKIELQN